MEADGVTCAGDHLDTFYWMGDFAISTFTAMDRNSIHVTILYPVSYQCAGLSYQSWFGINLC